MAERHSAWGEGTDVGLIGGTVVAVFFLILDAIAGVPLRTPSVLGEVMLFGRGNPSLDSPDFGAALLYTVVHFIAFALFGVLLVRLVHLATHNSVVRFGLLVLFLAFEVFFYGVVVILTGATSRLFPFWAVLTANVLATLAMGFYLWRTHPAFRQSVQDHPLGVPDER